MGMALISACTTKLEPVQKIAKADLKQPFELTGRAPADWPKWNQQGQIRFHLGDWLASPGSALTDQAVVQVTRENDRVFEVQFSYPIALVDENSPPIDTTRQGVYHYCIAARLAALQGSKYWGTGEAFDDIEIQENDRSMRLLALALEADHSPYLHLLPEHLRDSIASLQVSKARTVCELHMRPEFLW